MNYQNYEVISRSETDFDREFRDLGVSRYDRVAAMLVALLFLMGFATFVLWLMWISYETTANNSGPVDVNERFDAVVTEKTVPTLDEPLLSEIDQQTGADLDMTLVAVTEIVTKTLAAGDPDVPFTKTPLRTEWTKRPLRLEETPYRRWQIRFETTSMEEYARQLDAFGIELGVVGGGFTKADYAKGFAGTVSRRSGTGSEEKRFYMVWQDGTVQRFDRQLLKQAGIPVDQRVVMHFYSPEMLNELTRLELEAAAVPIKQLRKTVFGVRQNSRSYEFYVVSQY